jgi:hypothetical protein
MFSITLLSMLSRSPVHTEYAPMYTQCTLPCTHRVHCQENTEYVSKNDSEWILQFSPRPVVKDAPNRAWWHTPCLLDSLCTSKLSKHSQLQCWVRSKVHFQVYSWRYYQLHSMVHSQPA